MYRNLVVVAGTWLAYALAFYSAVYVFGALSGYPMVIANAGILVAGLLLVPSNRWLVLVSGVAVIHLLGELYVYGATRQVALIFTLTRTSEGIVSALVIKALLRYGSWSRIDTLVPILLLVVFVLPFVFSMLPTLTLSAAGSLAFYIDWALAQGAGVIVTLPVILLVDWRGLVATSRRPEMLALLIFTALLALVTVYLEALFPSLHPILFMFTPALLWWAARFGLSGAALVNVLFFAMLLTATWAGLGPFTDDRLLPWFDACLISYSAMSLLLGCFAEERLEAIKRERSLSLQMVNNEESYRRKIATSLHDDIGQNLALANIQLDSLRGRVSDQLTSDGLERIASPLGEAINAARAMNAQLSQRYYRGQGLQKALHELIASLQVEGGPLITLDCNTASNTNHPGTPIVVRVVRESLVNALKYADADKISVTVDDASAVIKGVVQDDGDGFDTRLLSHHTGRNAGIGIHSLRSALLAAGGGFSIRSTPGTGTKVEFFVPYDSSSRARASNMPGSNPS